MNENKEKRIKSQILKSECSRELMGGIEGIIKFLQNAKAKYEKENWQDFPRHVFRKVCQKKKKEKG